MVQLNDRAKNTLDDLLLYSDLQENIDLAAFTEETMVEFALITMKLMFNSPPMLPNIYVLSIALGIFMGEDDDGDETYEFTD